MSNIDEKIQQEELHFEKISAGNVEPGALSQSILEMIRKMIDFCLFKRYLDVNHSDEDYSYDFFQNTVRKSANSGLLGSEETKMARFHAAVDVFCHESMDENVSQALLYHFYPKIEALRSYAFRTWNLPIFKNFEIHMPPLKKEDQEFYTAIAQTLDKQKPMGLVKGEANLYYIVKERPFFVKGKAYYELVLDKGFSQERRTDCFVAFSNSYLPSKYAHFFTFIENSLIFHGHLMPFKTVATFGIHIRAVELRRLGLILGISVPKNITKNREYRLLINTLESHWDSLASIVQFSDEDYLKWEKSSGILDSETHYIKDMLDKCHAIVASKQSGANLLLLLLHTMNCRLLRDQIKWTKNSVDRWVGSPNSKAGGLCVKNESLPFDTLPYASYPAKHPIPQELLFDIIDPRDREYEFLDRSVETQTDDKGILYVPEDSLNSQFNIDEDIAKCNQVFISTNQPQRQLIHSNGRIFVSGVEKTTADIITILREFSKYSSNTFTSFIDQQLKDPLLNSSYYAPEKISIARKVYSNTTIAFVIGAAGTGKTTFIGLMAHLMASLNPLILSKTNAASDNLQDKIKDFRKSILTLDSYLKRPDDHPTQFCIVDECSTISNDEMLKLLSHFKAGRDLLLLVGDEHQIESIHFGNWFSLSEKAFPSFCYELGVIYRAQDKKELQKLWNSCRKFPNAGDPLTLLGHGDYTRPIEDFDFKKSNGDGVVLCLNYDGLYGINNINRIMQANNPGKAFPFRDSEFRIGDPIIFSESRRLAPYIHNGMHGVINNIVPQNGGLTFEIALFSPMTIPFGNQANLGFTYNGQDKNGHQVISLSIQEKWNQDDDADDSSLFFLPFEVAYAVSIHKAQGLEYSNVRIIVTDGVADRITPNIFYTAITRTMDKLKIYWSPASALSIINRLDEFNKKNQDFQIFKKKFPALFIK